jgi:hypothetical protein
LRLILDLRPQGAFRPGLQVSCQFGFDRFVLKLAEMDLNLRLRKPRTPILKTNPQGRKGSKLSSATLLGSFFTLRLCALAALRFLQAPGD